jgi:hypothetical protein
MSKYGWKFAVRLADGRIVSDYDKTTEWKRGEWNEVAAPSRECVGLNDSPTIREARGYVQGTVLLRTEHAGVTIKSGDKTTCEKMRALHAYDVSDYYAKIALLDKDYDAKRAPLDKDYYAKIAPLDKDYYAKIAEFTTKERWIW